MSDDFLNAILPYMDILYKCNQELIKLNGADAIKHMFEGEKIVLHIIDNIPRIIPFGYDKKKKKLIIKGNDGLIEFDNQIGYLKDEYIKILDNNYQVLNDVKDIRNKYEHKVHNIKITSASSGSAVSFTLEFLVRMDGMDNKIKINSSLLINLFKDLNNLFSRIVDDIGKEAFLHGGYANTLYNEKLSRFDFIDFNEIYDCNLCKKIGRLLFDF